MMLLLGLPVHTLASLSWFNHGLFNNGLFLNNYPEYPYNMRLDRFISKSTELTQQQVSEYIRQAKVWVNGVTITDETTQVHENNVVQLQGQTLVTRPFRYLLFNKPQQTLCSNVDGVHPSLFSLIDIERQSELHIAGRLDADTTGLVLITDDGRWTFNITSPAKLCHKTYRVNLAKPIKEDVAERFANGILLQGEKGLTLPAKLTIISAQQVLLTLTEGKFHQVKRMFAAVGNKVVALHRQSIGAVSLDVPEGQWRYLTAEEISSFYMANSEDRSALG
ncbi:pseudouridine synthase [Shewanella ulleungensis]|jgi:16S rRNA pseudouridine516 synthase|uniref:Pseudouridine synthase n=2 Tax=Shewanella ulleungensis TaxID=2282699 RepID=A0ABQ2QI51_9GAMM|nr:pseudouridine synthase [Shewanella ulleungensis]